MRANPQQINPGPGSSAVPPHGLIRTVDLGRLDYAAAYLRQQETLRATVDARAGEQSPRDPLAPLATILFVEHPDVITVSRRPTAAGNVLFSAEHLASLGVQLHETDRGGDVTYHGPGQLVAYPIVDLNAFGLRLHDYMRLLEQAVIDTLAVFGVLGQRDPAATGVWTPSSAGLAKVCAMGVRVRHWVSMHGLALNVSTDLRRFQLIVPCGLVGRPVTSLHALLGNASPDMHHVMHELDRSLRALLLSKLAARPSSG